MTDLNAPRSGLGRARLAPRRLSLQGRAMLALLAAMLGAWGAIALLMPQAGLLAAAVALGALGAGGLAMLRGLARSYPHPVFGLANAITLVRGAGVAVLAAAVAAAPPDDAARWAITALAALILLLDGLDGWAARRAGLVSRFGARFDVEVDTAFALVLAILVWQAGAVGAWVVLLGLFRPAFVMAGRLWPPLAAPLPEAYWRKTVCVIQIGALIALISPAMPVALAPVLAGAVLAMLLISFARDIHWLARGGQG